VAILALVQGFYFLLTGVWPIVSIRTFMMVTGPKTDIWLVKTVGVLITVIGSVLVLAGSRNSVSLEVVCLAIGGAVGLTGIDIWYVFRRIISPIYLLDAALELVLVGLWLLVGWFS